MLVGCLAELEQTHLGAHHPPGVERQAEHEAEGGANGGLGVGGFRRVGLQRGEIVAEGDAVEV